MFCSICLLAIGNDDDVSATTCGHCFHNRCIESALKKHENCPICRKPTKASTLIKLFIDFGDTKDKDKEIDKLQDDKLIRDDKILDLKKNLKDLKDEMLKAKQEFDRTEIEALKAQQELDQANQKEIFEKEITQLKRDLKFSQIKVQRLQLDLEEQKMKLTDENLVALKAPATIKQEELKTSANLGRAINSNSQLYSPSIRDNFNQLEAFRLASCSSVSNDLFSNIRQSEPPKIFCKACKVGCSKGYCVCNRFAQGCTSACGCTGCFNPFGTKHVPKKVPTPLMGHEDFISSANIAKAINANFQLYSPFSGSSMRENCDTLQTYRLANISNDFSNSRSESPKVSCKACKAGCSKGYCICNKYGKGCTSACGCTGCFNPFGKRF